MTYLARAQLCFVLGCTSTQAGSAPPPPPMIDPTAVVLTRDFPGEPLQPVAGTVRYGAPLWPRIEGVAPGTEVTLRLRGAGEASWARYVADDAGTIDVTRDAAVDGSYRGIEPDGLVWSLAADPSASTDPAVFELEFELAGDAPLPAISIHRSTFSETAHFEAITQDGLVAELYTPANATGPLPALIAFGGSEGGITTGRWYAQYWAGRGYAVLALAYFGAPGIPATLSEVPVEYFGKAIAALRGHPGIAPTKIGVLGASRGGEAALLVGAAYPELAAVVAEEPSGVAWGTGDATNERASWTQASAPVSFIRSRGAPAEINLPGGPALAFRPMFVASLSGASAAERSAAEFRVERSMGRYLLIGGKDDQIWPSCDLADIAYQRLVGAGRTGDEMYCYADAGHWMGMPGDSTLQYDRTYDPSFQQWLAIGGTPSGIGRAQRDSTDREIAFLARTLGGH